MQPLVSIITASYNYENYIGETIESVIAQTYQNWELIVIDDGSKDNSIEVIKKYCEKDSRVRLYTHENNVNKGLVETMKFGLTKSNGEYIAFLESDDLFTPTSIEEKVKALNENPDVNLTFTDVESFGDEIIHDKTYLKLSEENHRILTKKGAKHNLFKYFEKYNLISTFSCIMVRKQALLECDFATPIPALLDYFLYIQICSKSYVYYIDKKLTRWRRHKDSFISVMNKEKIREFFFVVYKMMFKYGSVPTKLKMICLIILSQTKSFLENFIKIKTGSNGYLTILGWEIIKKG